MDRSLQTKILNLGGNLELFAMIPEIGDYLKEITTVISENSLRMGEIMKSLEDIEGRLDVLEGIAGQLTSVQVGTKSTRNEVLPETGSQQSNLLDENKVEEDVKHSKIEDPLEFFSERSLRPSEEQSEDIEDDETLPKLVPTLHKKNVTFNDPIKVSLHDSLGVSIGTADFLKAPLRWTLTVNKPIDCDNGDKIYIGVDLNDDLNEIKATDVRLEWSSDPQFDLNFDNLLNKKGGYFEVTGGSDFYNNVTFSIVGES
jgi:hypothetical protein